jgi:hypothetical protein
MMPPLVRGHRPDSNPRCGWRIPGVNTLRQLAGYLLLLVLAFVPAIIGYYLEAGSNEMGMIYIGSLIWVTLLWFFYRKIENHPILGWFFLVLLTFVPAVVTYTLYGADMTFSAILLGISIGWMVISWLGLRLVESGEAYL